MRFRRPRSTPTAVMVTVVPSAKYMGGFYLGSAGRRPVLGPDGRPAAEHSGCPEPSPEAPSLLPTRGDSGRPLSLLALSGLVPTAPFALTVGSLKFNLKLGHPRHARPTHLSARAALALALAGSDSCQFHCGGAQAQQAAPGLGSRA